MCLNPLKVFHNKMPTKPNQRTNLHQDGKNILSLTFCSFFTHLVFHINRKNQPNLCMQEYFFTPQLIYAQTCKHTSMCPLLKQGHGMYSTRVDFLAKHTLSRSVATHMSNLAVYHKLTPSTTVWSAILGLKELLVKSVQSEGRGTRKRKYPSDTSDRVVLEGCFASKRQQMDSGRLFVTWLKLRSLMNKSPLCFHF